MHFALLSERTLRFDPFLITERHELLDSSTTVLSHAVRFSATVLDEQPGNLQRVNRSL